MKSKNPQYLRYIPGVGDRPAYLIAARLKLHHAIEWVVPGTPVTVTLGRKETGEREDIPGYRENTHCIRLGHESKLYPGLLWVHYAPDVVQKVDRGVFVDDSA